MAHGCTRSFRLSLCGPVLNVRKFSSVPLGPQDLLDNRHEGPRMLAFLGACVRGRANILISGGTSSGKTTLLGVLSSCVPDDERIITIEDAAELRLGKPHVVGLEARPANVESRGEVTVRDLLRNALRMRPDRLVIGEVRGGEALDMLQAMNTGHDGSLSTAHANSARHALWRLETMALMSDVDLPVAHVRAQVAGGIDLVVHTARLREGRRVVQIATVDGLDEGGGSRSRRRSASGRGLVATARSSQPAGCRRSPPHSWVACRSTSGGSTRASTRWNP